MPAEVEKYFLGKNFQNCIDVANAVQDIDHHTSVVNSYNQGNSAKN
jgi:hypothetical protein